MSLCPPGAFLVENIDIAHPINTETRQMLEERILLAYKEELQKALSAVETSDYTEE